VNSDKKSGYFSRLLFISHQQKIHHASQALPDEEEEELVIMGAQTQDLIDFLTKTEIVNPFKRYLIRIPA
jgi:hypothetical protein